MIPHNFPNQRMRELFEYAYTRGWFDCLRNDNRSWPGFPAAKSDSTDWEQLALHALSDLRTLGVPIEGMLLVTPEVLSKVDVYDREMTAYS